MTSPISKSIEELARDFVHEPEQWEAYIDSKGSNSVAWPPEWLLLCQAVEAKFGAPIPELEMKDVHEAIRAPGTLMLVIVAKQREIDFFWERFVPRGMKCKFDRSRQRLLSPGTGPSRSRVQFVGASEESSAFRGMRYTHVVFLNKSIWPTGTVTTHRIRTNIELIRRPEIKFLELNLEV